MINVEVAERLINNLLADKIIHDQATWMIDHSTVFVISDSDRWSCATQACAAGFIFLQEAGDGMVFDLSLEQVFNSAEERNRYMDLIEDEEWDKAEKIEISLPDWAAEKLGIDKYEADWIFYDFLADTDQIVNKLRFLISNPYTDISLYDDEVSY